MFPSVAVVRTRRRFFCLVRPRARHNRVSVARRSSFAWRGCVWQGAGGGGGGGGGRRIAEADAAVSWQGRKFHLQVKIDAGHPAGLIG